MATGWWGADRWLLPRLTGAMLSLERQRATRPPTTIETHAPLLNAGSWRPSPSSTSREIAPGGCTPPSSESAASERWMCCCPGLGYQVRSRYPDGSPAADGGGTYMTDRRRLTLPSSAWIP